MTFVVFLGIAAARTVRLLRDDTILDRPRNWVLAWLTAEGRLMGFRHWAMDLLNCPWCLSAWVSAAAVAVGDWATSVPLPFVTWLAVWWVACAAYWLVELLAETHDTVWEWRGRSKDK